MRSTDAFLFLTFASPGIGSSASPSAASSSSRRSCKISTSPMTGSRPFFPLFCLWKINLTKLMPGDLRSEVEWYCRMVSTEHAIGALILALLWNLNVLPKVHTHTRVIYSAFACIAGAECSYAAFSRRHCGAQSVLLTHTAGYFVYDIFVVLTHWKDFKEDFCTLIHHGVGTIGRYLALLLLKLPRRSLTLLVPTLNSARRSLSPLLFTPPWSAGRRSSAPYPTG